MTNNSSRRNIKLLGILNLFMDIKLYGAIAIIYFTSISGSMALGMSIFSITMISSFIFEIPTGIISDRIGRKKTILMGTIFSLMYSIFFAISNNYMFLVIGAILEGIEIAFFSGNNDSLLYDTLKDENNEDRFQEYLGKTNSMYQVAGAIGAIAGGVVAYLTSFTVVMWISVIPKVINLVIATLIVEPKSNTNKIHENPYEHLKEAWQLIKGNKTLMKQFIADGLGDGIGEATYQFRAKFYQMVWPIWALGIPGLLSNIGAFFGNWYSGKIIKKYGNKNTLIIGNVYSILSNVLGVIFQNVISPIIIVTNSVIPTKVAKEGMANKVYSDKHRATMASMKSLVGSLMYAIFAVLVGLVADNFGIVFILVVAQIPKLIIIKIYIDIFKENPQLKN